MMKDGEKVKKEWAELHVELVNKVVRFCKEHGIEDVDEFWLSADMLSESIKYGEWCPMTDSPFELIKYKDKERKELERVLFSM